MTFNHGRSSISISAQETSLTMFATFVLWSGCLIVGVTGLLLPHRLPSPPRPEPPPIAATMLNVSISNSPSSPNDQTAAQTPPPEDQDPAPAPPVPTPSNAPPLQEVAEPSAKIAFALPVKSTGPIVSAAAAVPSRAADAAAPGQIPGSSVQHLVFGQGKGQQPAPEYPREAALAGEEGTVIVQFTVDADGRVDTAFAKTPCRSMLLNQAAVRTIRDSWRFKSGPRVTYDIAIIFQLSNQ